MTWIWQKPSWPNFVYDSSALAPLERQFLLQSGEFIGVRRHIRADDEETLRIELIGDEAVKTSQIEGEILDRDNVQSSLRQQFGLGLEQPGVKPAERGISQMMVDLYRTFAVPLTRQSLFDWHKMLLQADRSVQTVGSYRTGSDPMQVVSGPDYKRTIHFEAPPSSRVRNEMKLFITWFNDTGPGGAKSLPALTRAGIAHLHFECIHPFEDGNGRIGRALSEKVLAQSIEQPSLIALSYTIERDRKGYYAALERNNRESEITDWLTYFANTILKAQQNTLKRVDFYLAKARFYEQMRGRLNERQQKVIARLFRAGIDGFEGGLSAENYLSITRTTRATATRDLRDLVEKGALTRTGALRHTRYHLKA